MAVDRPAAVEDAVQVGPPEAMPVLVGQIAQDSSPGGPGIAYQNVKLTKIIQHIVNHVADLIRVGDIGLDGEDGVALGGELLREPEGGVPGAAVVEGHGVACLGKGPDRGGADAPAAAGDENGFGFHGGPPSF